MPQLNRSSLLTDIISNIFTNITKFITGNNAQQRMVNIVDSVPNILSDANQPNGYVATDANNNIMPDFIAENTLYLSVVALAGANQLYLGKSYIINDADGSSRQLLVRVATVNTLFGAAYDIDTGESGTYDLATDTFTPLSGGGGSVVSVTGNIVDNTIPSNPVVTAVYVQDAAENVYYDGVQPQITLGDNSRRNVFHQDISNFVAGDTFRDNAVHASCGTITVGNGCNNCIFEQSTQDIIFGDDLQFVTVRGGNYAGLDLTTSPTYDFIYGKTYPAEIFLSETDVPFHKFYDSVNSRFVLTNLNTLAVTYIGPNIVIDNKTANYTLVLSDANKMIEMSNVANTTITIPLNSSVAFPIGTSILVARYNTGEVTIAGAAGVTLRASGNRLRLYNQYSIASLIKRNTDEWYLSGDIKV